MKNPLCHCKEYVTAQVIFSCVSQLELNTLGKREIVRVVYCAGRSAAILLPCITTGLATTACLLLTSEGSANLSARRADVAIDETTVAAERSNPLEVVLQVLGEEC